MTFLGLIVQNLLRQRVRSLLTLLGIGLGITTVIALGSITAGLKETAAGLARSGGADFMVAQKGAADLSFSRVPEATVAAVGKVDGVARARGVLFHITKVGDNAYFFLTGMSPADLAAAPPDLVRGRVPTAADEVVLGRDAVGDLGLDLGGRLKVGDRSFRVVGVYDAGSTWERGGAIAQLPTVQELASSPGNVTVVYVTVERGRSATAVAKAVKHDVDGVVTITGAGDYGQVDQGFQLIDSANLAISFLAVVIGGIGVMNTMIMSIFERTREIGVLRAVGWSGRRVLRMILTESILLCILAAFVGAGLGVFIASLATRLPSVGDFMVPAYVPSVFFKGFVVALVVGFFGALYPAVRATRLTPMEALRYE